MIVVRNAAENLPYVGEELNLPFLFQSSFLFSKFMLVRKMQLGAMSIKNTYDNYSPQY